MRDWAESKAFHYKLEQKGFTKSGMTRFVKTLDDYSDVLIEKSVSFGKVDKVEELEITHDHVKAAAHSIARSFGQAIVPEWMWMAKAGQYICAALLGVATNHLDKVVGTIGFLCAFCVGGILLYVEQSKQKS